VSQVQDVELEVKLKRSVQGVYVRIALFFWDADDANARKKGFVV
jgi:hypothetical protein